MLQQNKMRNFKLVIALMLCYLVVYVFYAKIVTRLYSMPMRFSVMLQLVTYIVLGGMGIYLFRAEIKEGFRLWKEQPTKNSILLVGACVINIVLNNLAALPSMLINPEYESVNEHSVAELQGKFPGLLLIIAFGIMGPIVEEAIFRMVPVLLPKKKKTKILGIIVASILFMVMHMHGFIPEELLSNLPMFVTGIIYGAVLLISRNATIPMALHILNNLPAIIILLLSSN